MNQLTEQVIDLKAEISTLKQRLTKYENPKNSSNSSVPPSKDENRPTRNQSLRNQQGKRSGGQAGHKGETLRMIATPDAIIGHSPDYCQSCGKPLLGLPNQLEASRQVIDIPVIRAFCTEHRQYSKLCSCGHRTVRKFPQSVKAPVQYGSGIETLICYLHGRRQYIPYARMQEMIRDSYGITISQGSIDNIIKRFACKAANTYERIKTEILHSAVVGSDETGIKVEGKKHWAWTWQDVKNTLISISPSRGIQAIADQLTGKMPETILCHDAWRAQFWIDCKSHQLCCAHLLRDLNYLNELHNQPWSIKFKKLISQAIKLKRQMTAEDYTRVHPEKEKIINAFEKLLEDPPDKKYKELHTFYKRIFKYKEYIFPFLDYENVPPDNNASERAIRNIKVKQKISGQFRSIKGAQNFATIRSVIDTLNKRNLNIFQNLQLIANLDS